MKKINQRLFILVIFFAAYIIHSDAQPAVVSFNPVAGAWHKPLVASPFTGPCSFTLFPGVFDVVSVSIDGKAQQVAAQAAKKSTAHE